MPLLEVKNLVKEFNLGISGKRILFKDLSFSFGERGNFLSILAPFGTGKTTLLKIIAGIDPASSGEILIDKEIINKPDGRIVFIPEESDSFPWLNVIENIRSVSENSIFKHSRNDTTIPEIIKITGLEGYENHYPDNKSRGFRFRISIGRALILNPAFILIDNSLKNFDETSKIELFEMLNDVAIKTGVKFIIATADISTAARLSDRVIILKGQPADIAGNFEIKGNRDKSNLMELLSAIENIFQNENTSHSVKFTI